EDGDADVEPESAVDGSELAAGEDDDEAEHAVNDGHGEAVRAAEEETAKLRRGLCARADDGEVDGYEGQDAGGEVECESADEDEQNDGDGGASLEPSRAHATGFGIVNELDKVGGLEVAAGGGHDFEVFEGDGDIEIGGIGGRGHDD